MLLFLAACYPVLALAALIGAFRALRSRRLGILDFQLAAALVTALMGALDAGSSYNVFIPAGAFCIVCGTIELAKLETRVPVWKGVRPALAGMLLAFVTLLRDPRTLWIPSSSRAAYADLRQTIQALPGNVYAPTIGQFADGAPLYPAAHWVALDDMMRGRHRTAADSARARLLLDPLRRPPATAFILSNEPLASTAAPVRELAPAFTLVQDYGARFESLAALPGRFTTGWPRYLYRFTGSGDAAYVR